jgi:hypothetical protein
MIIPTRTSSQDSATINYFLIINSYILCGRIIAPVIRIRTAFPTNATKILMYQSQRTVSFWINKTVSMINKKYCKIRANINSNIKGEYFGE